MKSFGERLKLEREKRAITLEQISTSTKIGTRMLQALESENFDQLPGGIFNKGFVRAYARHVGLDEDQAVADYLEASGQNLPAADPVPVAEQLEPFTPGRRMPLGWAAAGLLVVALSLTLWSRWCRTSEPEQPPPTAASHPVVTPSSSVSATSTASVVSSPISSPSTAPPKPAANPAVVPPPSGATNVVQAASNSEFTIVVLAQEESWASFQIDDKPAVEDNLIADSQRTVHARNQVVIKVGNAGGVDFVFNGKKLPSQGDYGEVKTITFGPSGLQLKAAAPHAVR